MGQAFGAPPSGAFTRLTLTAKRERDAAGRELLRLRFPSGNELVLNRPG